MVGQYKVYSSRQVTVIGLGSTRFTVVGLDSTRVTVVEGL